MKKEKNMRILYLGDSPVDQAVFREALHKMDRSCQMTCDFIDQRCFSIKQLSNHSYDGFFAYLCQDNHSRIMPQINKLPASYDNKVVFVSDHDAVASSVIGPKAIGILLTKELKERLPAMIDLLKKTDMMKRLISFRTTRGVVSLPASSILYIDFSSRRAIIHSNNGEYELTNETLKSVYEMLPGSLFFMINRSHIINIYAVSAMDDNIIIVGDETLSMQLHVSKRRKQDLKNVLDAIDL